MKKLNSKKLATGILIASFAIIGIWVIPANFEIVPNYSESLPYKWVLVKKGLMPSKRDQAFVFYVRDNALLGVEKIKFIKLVGGLPGDDIEVKGGEVYYDGIEAKDEKNELDFYYGFSLAKFTHPQELEKRKITIKDKEVKVSGNLIGVAKPFIKKFEDFLKGNSSLKDELKDRKNLRLHAISPGVIPPHQFFAYTPHKDSFDSRYQEIGLIDEKDIIGTAILTF
jgi:hypothetical protein